MGGYVCDSQLKARPHAPTLAHLRSTTAAMQLLLSFIFTCRHHPRLRHSTFSAFFFFRTVWATELKRVLNSPSDKNKRMFRHLLYMDFKGDSLPWVACMPCCKHEGLWKEKGCVFGGGRGSGRDCYEELCFLIAVPPTRQNGTQQPPCTNCREPCEALHHEEGAPALLFLMVASEHSASEESQSESPNCSGL